jgi:hypothetical protein
MGNRNETGVSDKIPNGKLVSFSGFFEIGNK